MSQTTDELLIALEAELQTILAMPKQDRTECMERIREAIRFHAKLESFYTEQGITLPTPSTVAQVRQFKSIVRRLAVDVFQIGQPSPS